MDFSISTEQQSLYDSMRRLAADVVAPGAAVRDKEGRWDRDVWQQLAKAGVAGMPIPEEYGGSGGSILDCCLVNEALAEGGHDGGLGLSLGAHSVIGTVPIWLHGSEELKQKWLPGLCDGTYMGAWASTEPESGSAWINAWDLVRLDPDHVPDTAVVDVASSYDEDESG